MAREDVKAEDSLCRLGDGKEEGEGEDGLWEHVVELSTSLQPMTGEERGGGEGGGEVLAH